MRKTNLTTFALGIIINLLLTGCEQKSYEAVYESICVINNSDYTVHIKYDSTNFYIPHYYAYDEYNLFDSIPSGKRGGTSITYRNYNLIMRDTTFSRVISGIRIYRIQNGDTIYINTEKYNQRSSWKTGIYENFEQPMDKNVFNELEVNNSMF